MAEMSTADLAGELTASQRGFVADRRVTVGVAAVRAAAGAESPYTWANLVTAIRVVGGMAIFGYAAWRQSPTWNFVGLGFYWSLDVADGYLARRLDQETRLGAQLDIVGDRLLVFCFYLNYLVFHPELLLPILLFLLQFAGIDQYLSNQFLRWPIRSPNYFYAVDRTIWLWNWSTAAKLLNSAGITGLMVVTRSLWPCTAAALAIIGLKLWSCVRLQRLPAPEECWRPLR